MDQEASSTPLRRFKNAQVEAVYRESTWKRQFLPERSVDFDELRKYYPGFMFTFAFLGWRSFGTAPGGYVPELVREFYACLKVAIVKKRGGIVNTVRVRGVKVDIDPATINSFYNRAWVNKKFDLYRLNKLRESKDSQLYHPNLDRDNCDAENRFWLDFICNRILPVPRGQPISREAGILIEAIATKCTIDIGDIISIEIQRHAEMDELCLPFPSLITGLCKWSHVPMDTMWDDIVPSPTQQIRVILGNGELPLDIDPENDACSSSRP